MEALLEAVNWRRTNVTTRREVRNREVHFPPVSLYRWWARRPRSLIGALLEASQEPEGALVSDPFSGGGTVALEAVLRGFRVHAQDINPWAVWGLSTALDDINPDALEAGINHFLAEIASIDTEKYATQCPEHGPSTTLAAFWVRKASCPSCDGEIFLYPYTLVTLASRASSECSGFFGCPACGAITRGRIDRVHRCSQCRYRLPDARTPLIPERIVTCPHCSSTLPAATIWRRLPQWELALVQRWCNDEKVMHFGIPTHEEVRRRFKHHRMPKSLKAQIPPGAELNALHRAGFRRWADLYPPRQLSALVRAMELAKSLEIPDAVRNRILLAIAGTGEMAGYLCRWDRFHPKAIEALANHRYATLGLAVEQNPLARKGRGTIYRRLDASLRAARWMYNKVYHSSDGRRATITLGSSTNQPLDRGSVDLVVTDPPYYDAVQYGELSSLFLAWLQVATGQPIAPDLLSNEAVPNSIRNSNASHYERMLTGIFKETARTLADDGTVILTYHSTDFRGWAALGSALYSAGLRIVALGVGHSENELDHMKRGRRAFTRDLVIECRKKAIGEEQLPRVVVKPRTHEMRELLAAGLAIARANGNKDAMVRDFRSSTNRLQNRLIYVPEMRQEDSDDV